jgi:Protein of unknown function (DUF5818)
MCGYKEEFMFKRVSKSFFWGIPVLLMTLFPLLLNAEDTVAKKTKASKSVTGCLQKGGEEGGYILAGDDGSTWELSGKTVKLDEHVGHKVKVSGTHVHESKAHEATMEANEKKESGGKEYADLKVTHLKMVSESCK